jgi:hypothetical protein
MFHIIEMIFDASGSVVDRNPMPLVFDERGHAVNFIRTYLAQAFAGGSSGYQPEDDFWWGRDDEGAQKLHCFTIEH